MPELTSIISSVPVEWYIYLSSALLVTGILGILLHRNAIILLMCIELMLNASNLLIIAFSAYRGDAAGQVFVFFVMVVAAAEVAIGLAIVVMIYRNIQSVDLSKLNQLKW